MREEQIAEFFGQLGPIKKSKKRGKEGDPTIHMYMDKRTGRPKGDCTVSFEESETARAAIKWYDGKCFGVRRACSRARRAAPSASRAPAPPRTAPHRPTRHPPPRQNYTNTKLSISIAKRPDGANFGKGGGKGGGKGY